MIILDQTRIFIDCINSKTIWKKKNRKEKFVLSQSRTKRNETKRNTETDKHEQRLQETILCKDIDRIDVLFALVCAVRFYEEGK